jgi:hypothetical protein
VTGSTKPVDASDRFTEATRFDGESKTIRVVEGHLRKVQRYVTDAVFSDHP